MEKLRYYEAENTLARIGTDSRLMKTVQITIPLWLLFQASLLSAGECFCLVDESDNFRHSCASQQQGIRTVYHCRDDAGNPISMADWAGWNKLENGQGRCRPCKQPLKVGEGVIRGKDGEPANSGKQEKGGADEHAK
ncbi:MAG: hypothetical protein GY938_05500 [Ketobacter sp.]|nr:hypothetical protein [Ketobacter sp.]